MRNHKRQLREISKQGGSNGFLLRLSAYRRELVTGAYIQLLVVVVGWLYPPSPNRWALQALAATWLLVRLPYLFRAICWLVGMPIE